MSSISNQETCSSGTIWDCFMLGMASLIRTAVEGISCEFGCTTTASVGQSRHRFASLGTRPLSKMLNSNFGRWSRLLTGHTSARNNGRRDMVEVGLQRSFGIVFVSHLIVHKGSGCRASKICACEGKFVLICARKEHVGCARRGVEEKNAKVGALLAANALV